MFLQTAVCRTQWQNHSGLSIPMESSGRTNRGQGRVNSGLSDPMESTGMIDASKVAYFSTTETGSQFDRHRLLLSPSGFVNTLKRLGHERERSLHSPQSGVQAVSELGEQAA